jgi:hypothetical protein
MAEGVGCAFIVIKLLQGGYCSEEMLCGLTTNATLTCEHGMLENVKYVNK